MNTITEEIGKDNFDVVNLDSNMFIRENKGKIQEKIEQFNRKFIEAIRRLKHINNNYDYNYYEYKVAELSFRVDKYLTVESTKKLRQVLASIEMSNIILDEGIKNDDLECLTVAFSGLRTDLNSLHIFKDWFNVNITFKENKNITKSKQKMFNDKHLNTLVNLIINNDYNSLLSPIKYFFSITSEKNYDKQYYLMKIRYDTQIDKCEKIYNIFKKWKPYEKYNMGECRGTFLESLTYNYLIKRYTQENVIRESKIIINDYQTHTWDSICIYKENINCYECKFSIKSLKRGNIDNMLGILKRKTNINLYIVTLDIKEDFTNNILQLRENTNITTFNNMIQKFNLLTIEDFLEGNPF